MIIYKVENKINGKIYIGQTINSLSVRRRGHYKNMKAGSNTIFHRALRKYDKGDFHWSILDTADSIDKLNELETKYIREYNSFIDLDNSNGYNMTEGGHNCSPSNETIKLLRDCALEQYKNGHPNKGKSFEEIYGRKKSKEIKEKLRQINLGKTHSEKTKEKIRQGNLGKEVTDEFRKRMRDINMGRKLSKEARKKISKSLIGNTRNLGNKHTEETKKKISKSRSGIPSHNRIRIIQKDMNGSVIREWDSIKEAQDELGISNVSSVINGIRNSSGGYKWEKIDE